MARIVGAQTVKYTSKKTGKDVSGYKLYLTDKNRDVLGEETFDLWFGSERFNALIEATYALDDLVGAEVEISYGRRGGVDSITFL